MASFSVEYMAAPKPPPDLNIPPGESTVDVSIMCPTFISLPMSVMTKPLVGGFKDVRCPCYVFLITHPASGRKLIFDLGIREDWEDGPTGLVDRIKSRGYIIEAENSVVDVLREHGEDPGAIEAVIWSHYHFDHTGDPSTFPKTTKLIVGPGVKGRFPTAWPSDEKAPIDEKAWEGRDREEVSFDSDLKIGRFKAKDYFGDGSFYLLDTPGHLLGHVCGLARTTSDTFILMGGDAAHHAGEFRPTEYVPLPKSMDIASVPKGFPCPCPGDLLLEHIHPEKSATKYFYRAADNFNEDSDVADWTVDGIAEFDADGRVFSIIAHDGSLLPILDYFPKPANDWKARGWSNAGRWRFVADFARGLPETGRL